MSTYGFVDAAHLSWLTALVPLLLVLGLLVRTRSRRMALVGLRAAKNGAQIWVPLLLLSFGIVAWSRPYLGITEIKRAVSGADIMVVLDVSRSMLAKDTPPSRLEIARRAVFDLVDLAERRGRGDRIGLVLFAGESYLYCPPTNDHSVLKTFARSIDSEMISSQGSALNRGLKTAVESLQSAKVGSATILLITDGEDQQFDQGDAAAVTRNSGYNLVVLGVGTDTGSVIELPGGSFLKDRGGEIVVSRLAVAALSELASATGGSYFNSDESTTALEHAFPEERPGQATAEETLRQYRDIGPLLLLVPMTLLLTLKVMGRRAAFLAFLPLLFGGRAFAETPPSPHQAYRAYHDGDFDRALKGFESLAAQDPDDPKTLKALGSVQYKKGDYDSATRTFRQLEALQNRMPVEERFDTHYNLGNTLFMKGNFRESIKQYEQALELNADDERAKHNLEVARKMLKEQEQQKQEQEQQQQQQKDQDQEQNQDQQQKQQQNQSENQDQEEEKKPEDQESRDQDSTQQPPSPPQTQDENEPDPRSAEEQQKDQEIPLSEREARNWLDSLPDSPVLIQKQRRRAPSQEEQTW